MSAVLFNRICSVNVDTLKVTGLRTAFKVEKSLTKDPNTLDVTIYNLGEDARRKIQKKHALVKLEAGYEGNVEQIFTGDATIINSTKQGTDWITRLQSGDGVKAMRSNTVSESFAPGTSLSDVLKSLAGSTGLGLGNVIEAVRAGNLRNAMTEFSKGFSVSGMASDELAKVASSYGYELSVQDGALQLSQPGVPVGNYVVDLRKETGLIGSPEIAEVSAGSGNGKKTVIKARSLIQQKLTPGRAVHLQSKAITGFFRIEKASFIGDTHADPWYAELELNAT